MGSCGGFDDPVSGFHGTDAARFHKLAEFQMFHLFTKMVFSAA
jgi:hypothetical protein